MGNESLNIKIPGTKLDLYNWSLPKMNKIELKTHSWAKRMAHTYNPSD
jgi:hypothetical protein